MVAPMSTLTLAIALLLVPAKALVCPKPKVDGAAQYAAGKAQLDRLRAQDEHLPKKAYDQIVATWRAAAEAGSVDAQRALGVLVFGTLYINDAPKPAEKAAYVEAMAWVAVAARRGDAEAQTALPPAIMAALLEREAPKAGDEAGPGDDVPAEWVAAARDRAKAGVNCWPCTVTADDASWKACDGRLTKLEGQATPPERVTNHPMLTGPAGMPGARTHQGYVDVGDRQLIVLSAKPLECKGALTLTGALRSVEMSKGPHTYRGWSIDADAVTCR